MAWVAPSVKILGDLITAAIWNQDIKANADALYASINSLSRCVAVKTTNQTITSGGTTITWTDAEVTDTDAYHDPAGAQPTRFYVPITGQYMVYCAADCGGSTTLTFQVDAAAVVPVAASTSVDSPSLLSTLTVTDGSYVRVVGTSSGADRTLADAYFVIALISGGGLTGAL